MIVTSIPHGSIQEHVTIGQRRLLGGRVLILLDEWWTRTEADVDIW